MLLEVGVICSCCRDEGKRDAVRWGSSFEVTEAMAVPMEVKPNLILGPPCCVTAVWFLAKALTFGYRWHGLSSSILEEQRCRYEQSAFQGDPSHQNVQAKTLRVGIKPPSACCFGQLSW